MSPIKTQESQYLTWHEVNGILSLSAVREGQDRRVRCVMRDMHAKGKIGMGGKCVRCRVESYNENRRKLVYVKKRNRDGGVYKREMEEIYST